MNDARFDPSIDGASWNPRDDCRLIGRDQRREGRRALTANRRRGVLLLPDHIELVNCNGGLLFLFFVHRSSTFLACVLSRATSCRRIRRRRERVRKARWKCPSDSLKVLLKSLLLASYRLLTTDYEQGRQPFI